MPEVEVDLTDGDTCVPRLAHGSARQAIGHSVYRFRGITTDRMAGWRRFEGEDAGSSEH